MPSPVCVSCATEMRPEKNGFKFVTITSQSDPYQVWKCDKWKCPQCETEVLIGFGQKPIAEYYQEYFDDRLETYLKEGDILVADNLELIRKEK